MSSSSPLPKVEWPEGFQQRYEELQLRVTRFSSVEAQLVAARQRLDRQVAIHKRIQQFTTAALGEFDEQGFANLTAEAVVDAFEVEIGIFIPAATAGDPSSWGISGLPQDQAVKLAGFLAEQLPARTSAPAVVFAEEELAGLKDADPLKQVMVVTHPSRDAEATPMLIAANTVRGARFYDRIQPEDIDACAILAQQVRAHLASRATREALRRSEQDLSITLQSIGEAVLATNREGLVQRMNPAAERLCAYGIGEARGRHVDQIVQLSAVPDRAGSEPPWVFDRANQERRSLTCFLRNRQGEVFDIAVSVAPIVGPNGEIEGAVLIFRDVTEQRRADEIIRASLREKDALLKEVHHRVKNNLQIIASMLRLEARRTNAPESRSVISSLSFRVRAMALLHETLYKEGSFAAVDLSSYLAKVAMQSFRTATDAAGQVRLNLSLAPIATELGQATSCGLIVNELVTNSLKHAFPTPVAGAFVSVELTQLPDSEQVCLRITDNGCGLPADFESRIKTSLGMQLVFDLAVQLGGFLQLGPIPKSEFSVVFSPKKQKLFANDREPPSSYPRPGSPVPISAP